MTTRTSLAVLGPAIIVAVIVQAFNLTAILPPFLLAFLVALLASTAVLFQLNYSGKSASVSHKHASASAVAASSKNHSGKELGNVKWFNSSKGFGFITRDNGEEIFVHFRSIVNGKSLRDGQRVEFAVTAGTKGLQAENVVALK